LIEIQLGQDLSEALKENDESQTDKGKGARTLIGSQNGEKANKMLLPGL